MHKFDPLKPNNSMPKLPLELDLRNPDLLIQLSKTNIALAKLTANSKLIPNQNILMDFFSIKEWVSSWEIENISTTIETAFLAEIESNKKIDQNTKETLYYKEAIIFGNTQLKKNKCLNANDIIKLNNILLQNNQWILSSPDKVIKKWNKTIYTPPQWESIIRDFLDNFVDHYNIFDEYNEIDILLKLPMLHYQFEAIHPFWDWNWRVWRILAVLCLVLHDKLDLPILFLSNSILPYKINYHEYLNNIDNWVEWALFDFTLWFMIQIETQAYTDAITILHICNLIEDTKKIIKGNKTLSKRYSHEMIDYLFTRPYYKVSDLVSILEVHENTANSYFKELVNNNIVKAITIWREKYFFNTDFFHILKYGEPKN